LINGFPIAIPVPLPIVPVMQPGDFARQSGLLVFAVTAFAPIALTGAPASASTRPNILIAISDGRAEAGTLDAGSAFDACTLDCAEPANPVAMNTQPTPPLILWYDQPAESWMTEALPIGNGPMGAMLFGGTEVERIRGNLLKLPKSWRLLYQDGGEWRTVEIDGGYPIKPDQANEVRFKPVTTKALRLEIDPADAPCGIQEWMVD